MQKFFKAIAKVFFFTILFCSSVYAENITGSGNEVAENTDEQQNIAGDDTDVTVKSSFTLERSTGAIKTNNHENTTIVVESGATVSATNSNAIQAADSETGRLSITNSGTIKATSSKAINLKDAQKATITNNSGGIIQANTNTISMLEDTGDVVDDIIINNYGTIFATDSSNAGTNTIKSDDDSTNVTVNNFKGGHIYHTSESAVVVVGGSATLTNSGKIENKDGPAQNAITMSTNGATGATLILKDSGIVIGKINITDSGHTIKVNHGMGQSYYYDTTGGGSYDLEDLDGNIIVKGSVGSVGQGGNEILDELLGQKSINLRKLETIAKEHLFLTSIFPNVINFSLIKFCDFSSKLEMSKM